MPTVDLNTLTNREMEDIEEYVGRPIMGFMRRAFQAATKERIVKGNDPRTGKEFEETEEYLDDEILMDHLPTKIYNGMTCVARRRQDPSFTIDKWGDSNFGEDLEGGEEEAEEEAPDPTTPTPESSSATDLSCSEVPVSSSALSESGMQIETAASEPTQPSATSTQPTPSTP